MQVDHIRPKADYYYGDSREIPEYPPDDIRNLNPACRSCNNWKNTHSLEGFRHEISMQVERARMYSRNFKTAERFGLVLEVKKPVVFYFEKAD
jgi:hypothetical protein